jgi:LysR family malonate utilization transcriptional regulator
MPIDEEISLKKLEVFLEFMKSGNLGEVAEAVGRSTVSVHRSLHSLESGLRCPLFKKQGRNLVPLPAAHAFAEYAARAVWECESGIALAQEISGFRAKRVTVGCAYSVTVKMVPQLLQGLKTRRPQVEIDLKLGATKELLAKLRMGEIDAAIVAIVEPPDDENLVGLIIYEDAISLAAPLNSRYAKRRQIDLRDMKSEKFVALGEDFHTVQSQQHMFGIAGFLPDIVMRAGNLFALTNLVADGVGFGLLPNRVSLFTSKVQLIPLADEFASSQKIMLFLPKARERDPNLLAITAECRSLRG